MQKSTKMSADDALLKILADFEAKGREKQKKKGIPKGLQDLLDDLGAKPESEMRNRIMKDAKKGMYSDFMSDHAYPLIQLQQDLMEAGFQDLASKIPNGSYEHDFVPT
jgi:hypothetical protein